MEFLGNQLMITQRRNEQQHLFVHNFHNLPKPKSKIKNKNTSADTSNTSNTEPTRTSSWFEDKVKDKEDNK